MEPGQSRKVKLSPRKSTVATFSRPAPVHRSQRTVEEYTAIVDKLVGDIEAGEATAGMTIDFYGRCQSETVRHADGSSRISYVDAQGGTSYGVDPIALMRGAPHAEAAELFIEYTLTLDAQKLWNFRPGEPGGPERFALRRLPVRRDFYTHTEWARHRSDPDASHRYRGSALWP